MIRVGRRIYNKNGTFVDPSYPNFTPILCLTYATQYGALSPYCLKNDNNQIMENIYQFQKVYTDIPKVKNAYSRYNPKIIWEHQAEIHYDEATDTLTDEYWAWRAKGINNPYHVRYPVGFDHRHNCLHLLKENDDGTYTKLDYVNGRKQVYIPEYVKLVKLAAKFVELKNKLANGENLLIIEVDGPHLESLDYYKEKYGVDNTFIENSTMLVNEANIKIMLNDTLHPFGHGYALGMSLLDKDVEWNK
jgi:hypothetical protein